MGSVVFAADDGVHGRELWVADSDGGATLLADLNAGLAGSNPEGFTTIAGRVVFIATTAAGGRELWSVGHNTPPVQLMDIGPGEVSSNPIILAEAGGQLYFTATNATNGRELYVTDGTAAGTRLVKDIRAGGAGSIITYVGTAGDHIVFLASDGVSGLEMWASDGTAAGTVLLADGNAGNASLSLRFEPYTDPPVIDVPTLNAGDKLYYIVGTQAAGFEIWVTDGTAPGTKIVKDIEPGSGSSQPGFIAAIGEKVFFSAATTAGGRELWVYNGATGTAVALTAMADYYNGPRDPRVVRDSLYFIESSGGSHTLWTTDGTAAGTHQVTPAGVRVFSLEIAEINGAVVFRAEDASGDNELWMTHGQSGDAQRLADLVLGPGSSYPRQFFELGDVLIFGARSPSNGAGIWKTDGTAAGTVLIKELNSSYGDAVTPIGEVDGRLLFKTVLNGGSYTNETLWSTDGTGAGTVQLGAFVQNYPRLELPTDFTKVGDRYVYLAGSQSAGRELWGTDGTLAGTKRLLDATPGPLDGTYADFRVVDGVLYFTATTQATGTELWRTDGTSAGTRLVHDVNPAPDTTVSTAVVAEQYTAFKDGALFHIASPNGTYQLWYSDGTEAGTVRLTSGDTMAYTASVAGDKAFFLADIGGKGWELWVTDGTAAGTHQTLELAPGSASGVTDYPRILDDKALVSAAGKAQLWVSDGSAAGTIKLIDAGSGSTAVSTVFEDRAFVVVTTGGASQMWVTDGTVAGTQALTAIPTPVSGWQPFDGVVRAGSGWLFAGLDAGGQSELWFTDGTSAGTHLFKDINPNGGSGVTQFGVVGDKTFFIADDGGGSDLWVTDGTLAGTVNLGPADRIQGMGNVDGPWGQVVRHEIATVGNGQLLFARGNDLWVSDGTTAGTVRLGGPFAQQDMTFLDGQVYFSIRQGYGSEYDLWTTDGTVAGTVRLVERQLDYHATFPPRLPSLNGDFVYATSGVSGRGLWSTDGTVAGTRQLAETTPVGEMVALNGRLIFSGYRTEDLGTYDYELWSVGVDGAIRIDLAAGTRGSFPQEFTVLDGVAYFIADVVGDRYELWRTDGAIAGTQRVVDMNLGAPGDDIYLDVVNGQLVFMADDGVNGFELWVWNGAAATRVTNAVGPGDSNPGPATELPTPPPPPTLNGTVRTDTLNGTSVGEIINGLGGNDTLNGNGGDDTLNGGDGADQLFGGAGIDTLVGGAGNDRLDGGDGADVLRGGVGNDVYVVGAGDVIEELAGEGLDSVTASVSFTLSANVENLTLTTIRPIDGFGNDLANKITGTNYANRLEGGGGVDTLDGLNGNDIILGGSGGDIIQGGGGNDVITGGTGNDTIRGGNGADVFVVLQESVGVNEIDTLNDFYLSQGDIIDLSAIDANALVDGDQAFSLVSAFSKAAGQMTLTWVASQARTLLKLDVNGDGKVDYQMKINGNVTGASDDWAL